jgi:ABC-2 type transport system permease protein
MLAWTAILLAWGYGNGAIVEPVVDGLQDVSAEVMAIFGGEAGSILIDGYLAAMSVYNATMVAVFVVLGVLGIRSEEYGGRAAPVLATPISRRDWLGSHLIVLALGSASLLTVTGLAMGLGAAVGIGQTEILWKVTASHLAFIPAILVILAVAGLLYGLAPRAVGVAWAVVFYSFFMGFFAPLWDLPQLVLDLSPLEHIPGLPLEEFVLTPMLVLSLVAIVIGFGALASFRNRDLTAG